MRSYLYTCPRELQHGLDKMAARLSYSGSPGMCRVSTATVVGVCKARYICATASLSKDRLVAVWAKALRTWRMESRSATVCGPQMRSAAAIPMRASKLASGPWRS